MRKLLWAAVLIAFVAAAGPARAELKGGVIFKDTLYGALTGALIGGAVLVFTEEPGDHLNYIAYGAAAGAIAGAAFGVYESTAVAELSGGTLRLAVPTVRPLLPARPAAPLGASVDLFRTRF